MPPALPRSRRPVASLLAVAASVAVGCGGGEDGVTGPTPAPRPNEAPAATIERPDAGASFEAGDPVSFEGSADDPEDGTLTGGSLTWVSDVDGPIGTGQSVTTADLSADEHTVTLTATDSEGATDSARISISVSRPPSASITAPEDGTSVFEGEEVTFEGSAEDPEDGALTGDALVWESDVDGRIGTGGTTSTASLSAGAHAVTLTATDSDGVTGRAEISVTVEPNGVPTASITLPTDGARFDDGEEIAFEGSGEDPEDGALTGDDLVWDSDLDGELGTGRSFTRSDLSAGDHAITLTVTDSRGAIDTATVEIAVEGPPSVTISSPSDRSVFDEGTSITFEGSASDPVEGELSGGSLQWSSDVDGDLGTGSSVTRSDLSAGPHAVTLTATDGDGDTASETVDLLIESPGFDFRLRLLDDFTSSQEQAIRDALGPWAAALTGDLSGGFPPSDAAEQCLLEERGIDDLVVVVRAAEIDGAGGTLARAGPCLVRTDADGNFTTAASGIVTVDEADLDHPDLEQILTHEVGHVLGIGIGSLQGWGSHTLGLGTVDPFFTGPDATDAFRELGGREAYLDVGVPLANVGGGGTFGVHWRELNFDTELMTGFLNAGTDMPLSRVSVAVLSDIGYTVDRSASDPFSLPMPQRAIWLAGADATLSRPASSGENFGTPGDGPLGEALVAGSNNGGLWSSDPEKEVFSGLMRTELPVDLPSGVTLDWAAVRLLVVDRDAETAGHDVEVVPVTSAWSEGSVTWDGRPGFGSSAVVAFDFESCDDCFVTSDALTDLVGGWLDGSSAHHGLHLRAPDAESDPTFSVGFGTRHASSRSLHPRIVVEARTDGASQLRQRLLADTERIPLGDDVRSGFLYGMDAAGRLIRVEQLRAGLPGPDGEGPAVDASPVEGCCER